MGNKIFILEDQLIRINWFKENFTHCDMTFAIDIDEAIAKFQPPYDVIFFDHDLGGRMYVPSDDRNTGYQFAVWLTKDGVRDDLRDTDMLIHSLNTEGANNIDRQLQIYGNHVMVLPYNKVMTLWADSRITVCGKKKKDLEVDDV